MATKLLLLLTILIGLCFGYDGVHHKHHNGRLMKKERAPHHYGNEYNEGYAAHDTKTYADRQIEQQEMSDLSANYNNNNENDDDTPLQVRHKRRRRRKKKEFADYAHMFDADDAQQEENENGDTDGGMEEGSDPDMEMEDEEEYSEKKQLVAFLLSLFLGQFGAGRFYVGDITLGCIKLFLPLMVCCLSCIITLIIGLIISCCTGGAVLSSFPSMGSGDNDENAGILAAITGGGGIAAMISTCLIPCGICAWQIWWFVDWILFAMNEIPDADGKTLEPM